MRQERDVGKNKRTEKKNWKSKYTHTHIHI